MKNLLKNQWVRCVIFFVIVITLALLIVHFGDSNSLNARRY